MNREVATLDRALERTCQRCAFPLGGQPVVELSQPVLDRVDRHDAQHLPAARVRQEDVDEGDHLEGLAETHAVRQDAAEALTSSEPFLRLDDVVVEEPDASDLVRFGHRRKLRGKQSVPIAVWVADVHQDVALRVGHVEGIVDVETAVVWILVLVIVLLSVVLMEDWLLMVVLDDLAFVGLAA